MPLAVLEIYHSRPVAPTRRVALGQRSLPADPAPGWAGVLLGGIAAAHRSGVADDLIEDYQVLLQQIGRGHRVVQPRLRHRFQTDKVGLVMSRFALVSHDGEAHYSFSDRLGTPLQYLLGAAYAASRVGADSRRSVLDAIRLGLRWSGRLDGELISQLGGAGTDRFDDPIRWALSQLGMEPTRRDPSRAEVQATFRRCLRQAHPDHGGDVDGAGDRIADLREARRILSLDRPVAS